METMQIRLTKEMIKEIKVLVKKGIYPNTSEAVRDSVRRLLGIKDEIVEISLKRDASESKEFKAEEKKLEEIDKELEKELKEEKAPSNEVEKAKEKLDSEVKKQFQAVRGTEDYYPEEMAARNNVFGAMKKSARAFGFEEVDTPIVEDLDLLRKKQGEEIVNQIFVLDKKGDEELALRAEFTPSLARMFIAKQKAMPKPVKWFCINRVFRYERPQQGRQREFFQFNVEIYGSSNPEADSEIINLAIDTLKELGLTDKDFFVKVNNRKLIQGLLLEIVSEKQIDDVMRAIDKIKNLTEQDFEAELTKAGLNKKQADDVTKLFETKIENIKPRSELAKEGMKELLDVLKFTDTNIVEVDLSTVRGLAYYTGTVFEIFDTDEKFRSIAGGGRYDNMIKLFNGEDTPATGFGMGYSTLRLLLEYKKIMPKPDLGPDYYIAIVGDEPREKAFAIANELRKKHKVDIDLSRRNLKNQLNYANKIRAKKVIFIGSDEIKAGKLKIKDLESGNEEVVDIESFIS